MKWLIRGFFKLLRAILGPFLLLGELIFKPRAPKRSADEQAALDALTENLTMYQFRTCPFCIKARMAIARLGLKIRLQDAQFDQAARAELLAATGTVQVPCLRIEKGEEVQWLLESDEIISYLEQLTVQADATQGA